MLELGLTAHRESFLMHRNAEQGTVLRIRGLIGADFYAALGCGLIVGVIWRGQIEPRLAAAVIASLAYLLLAFLHRRAFGLELIRFDPQAISIRTFLFGRWARIDRAGL